MSEMVWLALGVWLVLAVPAALVFARWIVLRRRP
jgi:hypothetical protein